MTIRGLVALAMLIGSLLLTACGGGSGRQGSDIVVGGSGPTAQILGGQTAVFTMTVTNAGSTPAGNVSIVDTLGNQLSLVSISCTAGGGAVCPDPTGVAMTAASIPAGGQLVFVVTVQANANARGTVSNGMSARYSEDVDTSNNNFTATAQAYSTSTDIVVTGVGPGGTVTGGATVAFQMTVLNNGPDPAAGINIVNTTGNGITLTGIDCTATGGAVCPSTGVAMTADLPSGGGLNLTVNATVTQGVNGVLSNTMSANVGTDPDRSNNSFTATATSVTPQSGLFVTGQGPSGTVAGGSTTSFTMTVGNSGPDAATGVTILDNAGSNLTLTGVSCVAANGATCPASFGPVMSVDTLPVNGTLTFTVSAFVANGTNGAITNTMSATAANDISRTQKSATAVGSAATPRATLVLTGTGPAGQVAGGATAQFEMTVQNTGPNDATGLTVLNTVGTNLTFTGATCSVVAGGAICPSTVGVVTNVGTLPVNGQLKFVVSALVAPNANGSITNTISATADNAFSTGGNSAVAVGTAFTAKSSISVSGNTTNNVPAGSNANFVMTLSNSGPDVADTVHLINTLGNNLTLSSINCSVVANATCPSSLGPVMDVSALPVNGSLSFTVSALVAPGTQGTLTNSLDATVTSGVRTEVVGVAVANVYSANVSVSAAPTSGTFAGGSSTSLQMVVTNNGPGTALDVGITNVLGTGLSAGTQAMSCSTSGGSVSFACPSALGNSMSAPSIPPGGSLIFDIPVTVVAGTNGTVSDTMTVSSAGDPRSSDNSDTATLSTASPDLGVSQTGSAQLSAPGTAVFTATVSNPGPATASNVGISYALVATGISGVTHSIVCTPSSGATCPAVSDAMTVPSLPAGRSLTFTITVPIPDPAARGTLASTMSVSVAGDPGPNPNTSTFNTAVVDPRNGSYRVLAADGHEYSMSIDFGAGKYTMSVGGDTAFVDDGAGGYQASVGSNRFRTATDLIVGGHDFGAGLVPYIAARTFGSAVNEATGSYNLMTRDADSTAATHAAVAVVNANTLQLCQTDLGTIATPGSRCTTANGVQHNYLLTASNNVYTATEVGGTGEVFNFYLVKSDAAKFIVGASPGTPSKMRIGLQDSSALIGGTMAGASSSGVWIPSMTLTGSSYAVSGSGIDDASLTFSLSATGVGAMLGGLRSTDNQIIWVMQSSPLAVAFGDFTATGSAKGLLQITVP